MSMRTLPWHRGWALALRLVLVLVARPVGAATIEVPVPSLVRFYSGANQFGYYLQDTTLTIPGSPALIHSIAVRIHGSTEVGTYHCGATTGIPWATSMAIWLGGGFGSSTLASWSNGTVAGTIGATYPITLGAGKTWAGVTSNNTQLRLTAAAETDPTAWAGGPCGPDFPVPSWSLDECTVLIDADVPVPASPYSWGRLKAAYR